LGKEDLAMNSTGKTREAVGVFDDAKNLQAAIDDLLLHGFDYADLSLLASEHAVEKKLGHVYERVEELEDDPNVPVVSFVSTESRGDAEGALIGAPIYVAAGIAIATATGAGASLAATVLAALGAGGAGAAFGGVLTGLLEKNHAEYLAEQLDHGGLLLWVHTRDEAHEVKAKETLKKYSAHDVHVHTIEH
jgi:hypothetical protein